MRIIEPLNALKNSDVFVYFVPLEKVERTDVKYYVRNGSSTSEVMGV